MFNSSSKERFLSSTSTSKLITLTAAIVLYVYVVYCQTRITTLANYAYRRHACGHHALRRVVFYKRFPLFMISRRFRRTMNCPPHECFGLQFVRVDIRRRVLERTYKLADRVRRVRRSTVGASSGRQDIQKRLEAGVAKYMTLSPNVIRLLAWKQQS